MANAAAETPTPNDSTLAIYRDVNAHTASHTTFRRRIIAAMLVGAMALASLTGRAGEIAPMPRTGANTDTGIGAALDKTHFPTKCKSVIYLHCVGGPAQMDLYDYKPKMEKEFEKDLPESIRMPWELTTSKP